jgi:DeoR/GlpR family transcriptional regulator of sugar metabolism
MLQSARTVIVVADHQKFGRYAPVRVLSLDKASYLITDREPEAEMAEALSLLTVEVLVAQAEKK